MFDLLCFIRILQRIKKIKKSGCLNSVVYVGISTGAGHSGHDDSQYDGCGTVTRSGEGGGGGGWRDDHQWNCVFNGQHFTASHEASPAAGN